MISKLSTCIAKKLLLNGTISKEDTDLYEYGLFVMLSHIMFFCLSCVFGLLFSCIFESLVFYVTFQFIRKYSGGYHASSEIMCDILSIVSIFACIVSIKISKEYDIVNILFIISVISSVVIFYFSPLDTSEKTLSDKEIKHYRRISRGILFGIIIVIFVSYFIKLKFLLVPCCLSVILESNLLLAGKIKKELVIKRCTN